ncbi:HER184Wp [Eremothecium sinecaudum]|uniref:O-acyltransferase n=1 Tax=Eremothecium sinecaudum TaxID=45286 RepID=A0A109UZF8_9SACH|nr:HER184Wp [Eremothecium sinecaudum]AMD21463.1 HER184Wp [Eremothecium sinecaudum]
MLDGHCQKYCGMQDIWESKVFKRIWKHNESSNGDRLSLNHDQLGTLRDNKGAAIPNTIGTEKGQLANSPKDDNLTEDHHIQMNQEPLEWYTKALHFKERIRFQKDSGKMRSLLSDIKLGHRGTIMDDFVNYPLRANFTGPRLLASDFSVPSSEITGDVKLNVPAVAEIDDAQRLNLKGYSNNFSGFYVLFWMAISFTVTKVTIKCYLQYGKDIFKAEIVQYMTTDLWRVALFDLAMYLCTYFVFLVQLMCRWGYIKWNRTSSFVTLLYEIAFGATFTYLAEHTMKFKWISRIFLFLHSCVMLMKMHSFAFYNGYLWQIQEELAFSREALNRIKDGDENVDPAVIESLEKSMTFCKFELQSQSEKTPFPSNINIENFFMYTMFPILVYQIEYPRNKNINWLYAIEKAAAIFGLIFIMVIIAQLLVYPVAIRAISLRGLPLLTRAKKWPYLVLDMVPGFIVIYLLVWYLIWDAILNFIAEVTRFGDRYFYGDWWNCVDWTDFARLWNVPVHNFLRRHVYHSTLSAFHVTKTQASLITFVLSSLVHELSMYVIFGRLRFYLFFIQMAQLPLMAFNNSRLLRNRKVLLNILFWLSICTGPSMICTIYLTF